MAFYHPMFGGLLHSGYLSVAAGTMYNHYRVYQIRPEVHVLSRVQHTLQNVPSQYLKYKQF